MSEDNSFVIVAGIIPLDTTSKTSILENVDSIYLQVDLIHGSTRGRAAW